MDRLTGIDVSIQWEHRKVKRCVGNARIRLEYRKDTEQCGDYEQRLSSDP